jgi:Ubiquitin family
MFQNYRCPGVQSDSGDFFVATQSALTRYAPFVVCPFCRPFVQKDVCLLLVNVVFLAYFPPVLQARMKVTVKYLQESVEVNVENSTTLSELKQKIERSTRLAPPKQKLTHKGAVLIDVARTLEELGVTDGAVIYLNRIEVDQQKQSIRELKGKAETHEMAMMKDPNVKKMLENPDIMKNVMEMLPGLKKGLKDNPELSKMLESPQMIEDISKFAQDPEYMNNQMKNTDIALAKLEKSPEGYVILKNILSFQDQCTGARDAGRGSIEFQQGSQRDQDSGKPALNPWKKGIQFNPLVEYRKQMEYMKECGFTDTNTNMRLLIKHGGDADDALLEILASLSAANEEIATPAANSESQ